MMMVMMTCGRSDGGWKRMIMWICGSDEKVAFWRKSGVFLFGVFISVLGDEKKIVVGG